MAITGPPPKENRRRVNADTFGSTPVNLTEREVHELKQIPSGDWLPEVKLWWSVWTNCAQSQLFTATDWLRLRTLIVTMQSYYMRPSAQKMAEIRQTESMLGATYVDRMRARVKITKEGQQPAEVAPPAGVAAIKDYRDRLAG